jgi:hypothetical protein
MDFSVQLFSKKNTPFDRVVLLDFCLPLFDGESSFAPLLHRDNVPVAVRIEPISAFSRRPLLSSSPGSATGIEIEIMGRGRNPLCINTPRKVAESQHRV